MLACLPQAWYLLRTRPQGRPAQLEAQHAYTGYRLVCAGWFKKPDYIINDINIQSVIGYPAHNEVVPLAAGTYKVKGYAFAGGWVGDGGRGAGVRVAMLGLGGLPCLLHSVCSFEKDSNATASGGRGL